MILIKFKEYITKEEYNQVFANDALDDLIIGEASELIDSVISPNVITEQTNIDDYSLNLKKATIFQVKHMLDNENLRYQIKTIGDFSSISLGDLSLSMPAVDGNIENIDVINEKTKQYLSKDGLMFKGLVCP